MTRFQILDLETPIADLSSDMAGNITGGQDNVVEDAFAFADNLATNTLNAATTGIEACSADPECDLDEF